MKKVLSDFVEHLSFDQFVTRTGQQPRSFHGFNFGPCRMSFAGYEAASQ
jgi:hypothetical protein